MNCKKTEAIKKWKKCLTPSNVTEAQSFLGFTNYYHRFIPKYVQVAKPVYKLISGHTASKKTKTVKWAEECEAAFLKLKELYSSTPILAYTNFKQLFNLHINTFRCGLGAVLYQKQNERDRVIN